MIKKRAGQLRLNHSAHPLLQKAVLERMKAVLSRSLVVSDRKMLHAEDVHMALEALDSAVVI